jgi:sugar phosphate isomerase/epimerase
MRQQITFYALILFIFLGHDSATAQKNKKPLYTFPFGVQAYTFRKSFPNGVAATLDSIKAMGFTEIEGGNSGSMTPEEFKKLCDDRGISIPATGTGYEQLVKDPLAIANKAKALGAQYVMCAWIPHKGDFTLDNAKKAVEDFNAAGKVLKDNGVILAYHVHGYEFQPYEKGTLLDYIIKNTNPEYVSFEMDILWTQFGGGDPAKLLKKYGTRWKLLHVKDLRKGVKKDLTGGTSQENDVALGTGEIDIPKIIKEAKKLGIKHYFIEDESSKVNTQVPQSIAYLKSLTE